MKYWADHSHFLMPYLADALPFMVIFWSMLRGQRGPLIHHHHCFSFESTAIENATFPYETVLWKANVKTDRIRNTKWTYERETGFAPDYFPFWKVLFSCKSLLWVIDLMYRFPKYPYSYFSYGFHFYLWLHFFPVNIAKKKMILGCYIKMMFYLLFIYHRSARARIMTDSLIMNRFINVVSTLSLVWYNVATLNQRWNNIVYVKVGI